MGLDDLFKHDKHRGHGHHDDHGYGGSHGRPHDDHGHGGHHALQREMLGKLLANKPLLVGLGLLALVLLALAIWIALALLGFIAQYGVKGLLDKLAIPDIVKKLWEGVGK